MAQKTVKDFMKMGLSRKDAEAMIKKAPPNKKKTMQKKKNDNRY